MYRHLQRKVPATESDDTMMQLGRVSPAKKKMNGKNVDHLTHIFAASNFHQRFDRDHQRNQTPRKLNPKHVLKTLKVAVKKLYNNNNTIIQTIKVFFDKTLYSTVQNNNAMSQVTHV